MSGVKLTDIVEKMNLKNLTPEVDITERSGCEQTGTSAGRIFRSF